MIGCPLWPMESEQSAQSGVREVYYSVDTYGHSIWFMVFKVCRVGCRKLFSEIFLACIFYVDDLAILSPTFNGMQKMFEICSSYGNEFAISCNLKKTKSVLW